MGRRSFNSPLRLFILVLSLHPGDTLANPVESSGKPAHLAIRSINGPVRKNGYIVKFKPSVDSRQARDRLVQEFGFGAVRHTYNTSSLDGLAGTFDASQIQVLQMSPFVESIELDSVGQVDSLIVQNDATWGLQRISQLGPVTETNVTGLDYTFSFDSSSGAGVDAYVVDSGINVGHSDFEGRATWGKTFGNYTPDVDGLGHGTHVAGIIGGKRFGVAKKVDLIAVRIISADGTGYSSDCIAAVDWIISQTKATGRPSVINISVRFPPNDVLDAIVTDAVSAGIHVVVSAGNAASDASTQSPARAPAVTTVGATDITDSVAHYSNFGPLIDIFAPGTGITSDFITSDTATKVNSGTSMASPFVAGLTAYFIGLYGNKSPPDILSLIRSVSPLNKLSEVPDDTTNQIIDNGAYLLPGYQQVLVDAVSNSTLVVASVTRASSASTVSSATNLPSPSSSLSGDVVPPSTSSIRSSASHAFGATPSATFPTPTITSARVPVSTSSSSVRSHHKWCRYWWC